MNKEMSQAEQTLFNDHFEFATLAGWTAHLVLGQTDGFPTAYLRLIFDDETQRQQFLRRSLSEIGEER